MNEKKMLKNLLFIPSSLLLLSVLYTILVKFVDVKAIGPNESLVGFASVNDVIKNKLMFNEFFYKFSQILGYLALLVCVFFIILGIIQLIKRKSLKKVDQYILLLGIIYLVTIFLYLFFEVVVINYRPFLIGDGKLEASYPSSHTMLAIVVFVTAIIELKKIIKNPKLMLGIKIICYSLAFIMLVARTISGVHWFTDIFGGLLYSVCIVTLAYYLKLIIDIRSLKKI